MNRPAPPLQRALGASAGLLAGPAFALALVRLGLAAARED